MTALLIREQIAPALIGRSAEELPDLWRMFCSYLQSLGHTRGFFPEALSGVDLALWDLRAQRLNQTVPELLGGAKRSEVSVYAGSVLLHPEVGDSVAQSLRFVAEGFRTLKLKGGRGISADLLHLEQVRRAVGSDIDLIVDFNCNLAREDAATFVKAASYLNLKWIEEPFPPDDFEDYARLRSLSPIPLAAGENEFSVAGFARLFKAGAVDMITPNITRVGGISGLNQIAEKAAENGVQVSLHGVGGGVMLGASLQWMSAQSTDLPMELNCLPNPLRDIAGFTSRKPQEGRVRTPVGTGFGCELTNAFLERWRRET